MGYDHYHYARRVDANSVKLMNAKLSTRAYVMVTHDGNVELGSADRIVFYDGTVQYLITRNNSGAELMVSVTNGDIMLTPDGTGKVKFGTKTGTGDVAVDGHVDIKDAAGAAVKLATVA